MTNTLHIQGFRGEFPAVEIQTVEPGMTILWNQGETSEVLSVEPKGTKSVKMTVEENGQVYELTKRKTTLVVAFNKEE